jgi:fluoride exporter
MPVRRRARSGRREDVVMPHRPAELGQDVFRSTRPERRPGQRDIVAAIALGGGLGSTARYLIATALPVHPGSFPWSTFTINLSGCFAIGVLMAFVLEIWPPRRYARPFLGIGVLGGFTTFSTFAVEVRGLAAHGAWALAGAYALSSLAGGLAAVLCGGALARLIARRPRQEGPGA